MDGAGVGAVPQRRGADDARIAPRAVDLVLHAKHPVRPVGGARGFRFLFEHDGAHEILLRQQQFRLAVAVHVRRRQPGLFHRAAGRVHVLLIKIPAGFLQQHLDFFVGNQHHQVRQPVLVHVLNRHRHRVGLETFAQLLGPDFAVRACGSPANAGRPCPQSSPGPAWRRAAARRRPSPAACRQSA